MKRLYYEKGERDVHKTVVRSAYKIVASLIEEFLDDAEAAGTGTLHSVEAEGLKAIMTQMERRGSRADVYPAGNPETRPRPVQMPLIAKKQEPLRVFRKPMVDYTAPPPTTTARPRPLSKEETANLYREMQAGRRTLPPAPPPIRPNVAPPNPPKRGGTTEPLPLTRRRRNKAAKARRVHPRVNGLQFVGEAGPAELVGPHDSRTTPPWL